MFHVFGVSALDQTKFHCTKTYTLESSPKKKYQKNTINHTFHPK